MSTMTLGEIIEELEDCAPEAVVHFGYNDQVPKGYNSYRGYYNHLAISAGYVTGSSHWPRVDDFLKLCREQVGKTYEGYKGGEYTMGLGTPVWVAEWGRCTNTAIRRIINLKHEVVLQTKHVGEQ